MEFKGWPLLLDYDHRSLEKQVPDHDVLCSDFHLKGSHHIKLIRTDCSTHVESVALLVRNDTV